MAESPVSVHQLRRRWKPFKDRVKSNERYQPICIRIHRACSWLQRVEGLEETDLDQRLVLQWIAFNSLYGRWSSTPHTSEGTRTDTGCCTTAGADCPHPTARDTAGEAGE